MSTVTPVLLHFYLLDCGRCGECSTWAVGEVYKSFHLGFAVIPPLTMTQAGSWLELEVYTSKSGTSPERTSC
jgi:hypothetical protein